MSARSFRREGGRRAARAERRRRSGLALAAAGIAAGALPTAAVADDTITVTSNANSGPNTLRAALTDANSSPDHDTIVFASSVTGSINLSSELPVNYSTTIQGPGAANLELYGNDSRALFFYAFAPSTLEVEGLSIEAFTYDFAANASLTGTAITGNCIGSDASIELSDVAIRDSRSFNSGGAIFADGCDLSLERSRVTGNSTQTSPYVSGFPLDGGAITVIDAPGGGTADTLRIADSTLSGNRAVAEGGAVSVRGATPDVTIRDSVISDNVSVGGEGGALSLPSAGDVTIERSTISGNLSGDEGAGIYFGKGEALTVDSSTFSGNRTIDRGGSLFVYAHSEPFTVRSSTIAANSATRGGGIYSVNYYDKPVTVANSTIAGNSGDGIVRYGFDGIGPGFEGSDELTISSSIVANSEVTNDISQGALATGAFRIDNSIVGITSGRSGTPAIVQTAPGTNQLGVGAVALGTLANNGGPTQTVLPAPGGPAIDRGASNGLAADQRGLPRTVRQPGTIGGDGTDVGAVELSAVEGDQAVAGAGVEAKRSQPVKGKKVVVAVVVGADEDVTATANGTVKAGKAKLPLRELSVSIPAGSERTLKLKPASKRALRKVLAALRGGKKAKAFLRVTLTDALGNEETLAAKVSLRRRGS